MKMMNVDCQNLIPCPGIKFIVGCLIRNAWSIDEANNFVNEQ